MELYRHQMRTLPKLTSEDVKEETGIHMVFVTASPVLTNEVKQYYQSLKQQLASHLTKVEKVELENRDAAAVENGVSEDEKRKLQNFINLKEKELVQAEALDQQLQLPHSFNRL